MYDQPTTKKIKKNSNEEWNEKATNKLMLDMCIHSFSFFSQTIAFLSSTKFMLYCPNYLSFPRGALKRLDFSSFNSARSWCRNNVWFQLENFKNHSFVKRFSSLEIVIKSFMTLMSSFKLKQWMNKRMKNIWFNHKRIEYRTHHFI